MDRRLFLSVVGAGLAAFGVSVAEAKAGRAEKIITLTGTGKGKARYRVDSPTKRSFSVEVENLRRFKGQILTISLTTAAGSTTVLGTITVSPLGTGKLELETQRGQQVPNVQAGDKVTVTTEGGVLLLSGTF